ncbi:MAG: hypothetical protein JXQ99_08870 [Hyphomicrobiaceae bacterium]
MSETTLKSDPLLRDLVQWVSRGPRPYSDVMDAWRTHCPRLTIWEDAVEFGLVTRTFEPGVGDIVSVTQKGLAYVRDAA